MKIIQTQIKDIENFNPNLFVCLYEPIHSETFSSLENKVLKNCKLQVD